MTTMTINEMNFVSLLKTDQRVGIDLSVVRMDKHLDERREAVLCRQVERGHAELALSADVRATR